MSESETGFLTPNAEAPSEGCDFPEINKAEEAADLVGLIEGAGERSINSKAFNALLNRARGFSNDPGEASKDVVEAILLNPGKFSGLSDADAVTLVSELPTGTVHIDNQLEDKMFSGKDFAEFGSTIKPFENYVLAALVRGPGVSDMFENLGEGIFKYLLEHGPDFRLVLDTDFYKKLSDEVKIPQIEMLQRIQASGAAIRRGLIYIQHPESSVAAFDLPNAADQLAYIRLITEQPNSSDSTQGSKSESFESILDSLPDIFPDVDTPQGKAELRKMAEEVGAYEFLFKKLELMEISADDHSDLADKAIAANKGAAVAEYRDKLTGIPHDEPTDMGLIDRIIDQPNGARELAYNRDQFTGVPTEQDRILWDRFRVAGGAQGLIERREIYQGIETSDDLQLARDLIEAGYGLEVVCEQVEGGFDIPLEEQTVLLIDVVESIHKNAEALRRDGVTNGRTNLSEDIQIEASESIVSSITAGVFPGVRPENHTRVALAIIKSGRANELVGVLKEPPDRRHPVKFHDLDPKVVFPAFVDAGVRDSISPTWFKKSSE